jgi:hypothetical protein
MKLGTIVFLVLCIVSMASCEVLKSKYQQETEREYIKAGFYKDGFGNWKSIVHMEKDAQK